MPHIAEGDLHAWLDGEIPDDSAEGKSIRLHLESCPECAARLDEASRVRSRARGILAGATPGGEAPGFGEIRRRAETAASERPANGTEPLGWRRGWFSAQRLGWAATVMLALGAGWIGRAVLVEKGWTDPFNEGSPQVLSPVAEPESPDASARESFRDDPAIEDKDGAVRRAPEATRGGEARKMDAAGLATEEIVEEEAAPGGAGELAQAEEQVPEDLAAVDEVMEASPEADRMEVRTRSLVPPVDAWHDLPTRRMDPPPAAMPGCYRLEYSWSPGVAYVPGTLQLILAEAEGRPAQSIYRVQSRGTEPPGLQEAIWASPAPDSLWVRLVTREDRDAFTIRAEKSGSDWSGEGRVFRTAAPVSPGQTRGTVHLVRIECGTP